MYANEHSCQTLPVSPQQENILNQFKSLENHFLLYISDLGINVNFSYPNAPDVPL